VGGAHGRDRDLHNEKTERKGKTETNEEMKKFEFKHTLKLMTK
jgi:hypothetical protein